MRLILNILWILAGGALTALGWLFAGVLMAISIIGIPWARACFMTAKFSLLPFGNRLVDRRVVNGGDDVGTGAFGFLGNIIWFILGGWYLALGHLALGLFWCVTIIGVPFGVAHFRLMNAAIFPIGKMVMPAEDARAAYGMQ